MNLVQKLYGGGVCDGRFEHKVFAIQVIKEQSRIRRHRLVHSPGGMVFPFLHLCYLLRERRVLQGRKFYRTHVSFISQSLCNSVMVRSPIWADETLKGLKRRENVELVMKLSMK